MNITEFLLARIAEDEAVAEPFAAVLGAPARWHVAEAGGVVDYGYQGRARLLMKCELNLDARHIARWDPARVLAECAAKRAIVDECLEVLIRVEDDVAEVERGIEVAVDCRDQGPGLAWATLRHLAAVYADHPDYDQAWRP